MATNDSTQEYDSDEASIQLGKASGLACMCTGTTAVGDPEKRSSEQARDIRDTLQYVASIMKAVDKASADAPASVRTAIEGAAAVTRLLSAEVVVEDRAPGATAFRWSEEISDWALNGLVDAIAAAKKAVDDASCAEPASMVSA